MAEQTASTDQRLAVAAAAGGLAATLFTAVACVGPLVAILLGVGGFGWLTQYGYLRVPASIATAVCLAFGFYWAYFRGSDNACRKTTRARVGQITLWTATVLAVAVNLFEYVIFPRLG